MFALVLLCLPFAHMLFTADYVLTYRDLLTSFMPKKYFLMKSLGVDHTLPTWNPYMFAGTPFFADLKNGVLNPMNLIFLAANEANFFTIFNWFVFLHFPVLLVGMALFLSECGLPRANSILGGLLYSLSGMAVSSLNMCNLLAVAAILPFFMLCARRWERRPVPIFSKNAIGLVITLVLPIFVAAPEFSYFFAIYLIAIAVQKLNRSHLLSLAIVGALASGLAGVQVLPGLEGLLSSTRGLSDLPLQSVEEHVFHPARVAEFFLPLPFGNYVPENDFWARFFPPDRGLRSPFFFSLYLGTGFLVGFCGFIHAFRKRHIVPTLLTLFLAVVASGPNVGLDVNALLHRYFPMWNIFRSPEKLMIPVTFALITASALGWQVILLHFRNRRVMISIAAKVLAIVVLLLLASVVLNTELERKTFLGAFAQSICFALLFLGVFLALAFRPHLWPLRWYLILALIGVDLGMHARSLVWEQPRSLMYSDLATGVQESLKKRTNEIRGGGAFRYSNILTQPDVRLFPKGGRKLDDVGISTFTRLAMVYSGTSILFGIHDIFGRSALYDAKKVDLWRKLSAIDAQKTHNLLSVYYVGQTELRASGENVTVVLRENPSALPYIFIPEQLYVVAAREEILSALGRKEFNEKSTVLLETGSSRYNDLLSVRSISLNVKKTNHLEFDLVKDVSKGPVLVVVNETWDRFWQAKVEGNDAPLLLANGWAMALEIPSNLVGKCRIELHYRNHLIGIGLWIVIGVVCVFLMGVVMENRGGIC